MIELLEALNRSGSGLKYRTRIVKWSTVSSYLCARATINHDGDDGDGVVVELRLPDRTIRILRPNLTTHVAGGDFNCWE